MINENENEKIEAEEENVSHTEKVDAEDSAEQNTVENIAEEAVAEETNTPDAPEEKDAEEEKKTVYAFRWSYDEQYIHDKQTGGEVKAEKKKASGGIAVFVTVVLIAFAFALSVLFLSLNFDDMSKWFAGDPEVALSVTEIVEKGMPSSVSVYANKGVGKASVGSGFVINEFGYIVTNYHVVENSIGITVTGSNGKKYSASLIGYNKDDDIAVLFAEKCNLPPVTLGSSRELKLGETVVTIGTPGGEELAFSISSGDVSGLNRRVNGKSLGMIQTNAPLNPGNSGGALFDSRGNVVGIVTLKYTFTSAEENGQKLPYDGIGFALPISEVIGDIETMIRQDLETAKIGITVVAVQKGEKYFYREGDERLYAYERVDDNSYYIDVGGVKRQITEEMLSDGKNMILEAEETGIMVTGVTKGLGADGKLEIGDIITRAEGATVQTLSELSSVIKTKSVGSGLEITFYRNGVRKNETVVLMSKRDMLIMSR